MSNHTAISPRETLLELHRRLLQAQRLETERFGGRMNATGLLVAAAEDPRFSWLKELSELVATLDQAHADADAEAVQAQLGKARALLTPPDPASAFGSRYLRALQQHPEVVFAHRDAAAALAT